MRRARLATAAIVTTVVAGAVALAAIVTVVVMLAVAVAGAR